MRAIRSQIAISQGLQKVRCDILKSFGGSSHDAQVEARMKGETSERVLTIIAKARHVPVQSVTLDKTFEELQIDSLDAINIVFEIEEEFKVVVADDQVASLRSVRDMVDGIDKLLAAKAES